MKQPAAGEAVRRAVVAQGVVVDEQAVAGAEVWAASQHEWLPNAEDLTFIHSLMKPCHQAGQYASWIAPPRVGINNQPVDFEYVRIEHS